VTGPYTLADNRRRIFAPNDHLCGISDVGRVRDHNEDGFHLSLDGRLLIVADGMGGHEAGELASALAIQTLAEFFGPGRAKSLDTADLAIEPAMLEAFKTAHRTVAEAGGTHPDAHGMGTTLILALVMRDRLHVCHVGDVRCYVCAGGDLALLTQDHSVVGAMVRAGEISADEARAHPRKNEILQAIGLPVAIVPGIGAVTLEPRDRVLLCSDGLWEALGDNEIRTVLGWDGSMRQCATQLVDRANAAGGNDNITVVLYEHAAPGDWGEVDERVQEARAQ
jgi:protein phosphatase